MEHGLYKKDTGNRGASRTDFRILVILLVGMYHRQIKNLKYQNQMYTDNTWLIIKGIQDLKVVDIKQVKQL